MLHVYVAVGEVRVEREIRREIRAQTDFDIDATCVKAGGPWSQASSGRIGRWMVKTAKSIRLNDKQAPAADVADAMQFTPDLLKIY